MREFCIAVFGPSSAEPGGAIYENARRAGQLLAERGLALICGGYGGTMEAACRGAQEAGGRTIGVTCEIFRDREPNGYLAEIVPTRDLYERTRELVERAHAYLVLPGSSGTLAEVAFLWALDRAGCLGERPVILLGDAWRPVLRQLTQSCMIEGRRLEITFVVETPEQALDELCRRLCGPAGGGA
jgi:uncharacterized protein (TIGR00730 family)